jgi:hypothetical protein
MSDQKLSVIVDEFKPIHSNTLVGFVTVTIPELRLKIHDIGIHRKDESRWAALPGKPQLDRSGVARRGDNGKPLYTSVLEFTDAKTRSAFSHKVIASLLEFAPAAFEVEEEMAR